MVGDLIRRVAFNLKVSIRDIDGDDRSEFEIQRFQFQNNLSVQVHISSHAHIPSGLPRV